MSLPVTYFDPSLDFAHEKRMRLGKVTHDLIFSDPSYFPYLKYKKE